MTTEDLKKELGDLIWKMATNLVHGGKVSSVQFMDYTLGALFYRFISENITDYCNLKMREAGVEDADYRLMSDDDAEVAREQIVQAKGFFILPSQLFGNVADRARHNDELNTTLANNFKAIEQSAIGTPSEDDVKGLFNNFNTNDQGLGATVAERNDLLATLLESVRDLNFTTYIESGLDVFGICYEHLIKMYALNSGTKGGEFYTPGEVSYLLAMIAAAGRKRVNKVYDPACGSGSLLLNFNLVLGAQNVRDGFFGQEINLKTYNLCRMNMFLHNVNYNHFDIQLGDTLIDPKHELDEPFDAIVSNPPYSVPWVGDGDVTLINDPRFSPAGVLAPKSKADFAFTMHMLSWLSTEGTAAIVEFPGVLYRGGAEQKIRQYLVRNNYVDTVIQLPPNLFFGTSIATCIIVLKKNKADNRVAFIDASADFVHEGNKNKLSDANIRRIYEAHAAKAEEAHFCHVVTTADIEAEDWNLSVSTYVEQPDTREAIDIDELNQRIAQIVERQSLLRSQLDEIINSLSSPTAMNEIEKLIQEFCPDGVEYRRLGDVADCYSGATPKTSIAAYWENGTIPWMNSGEVNLGRVYKTENKITKEGYDSCSTKMVPSHTVVIALAGQGKTRGTVAITEIELCTNQSLCAIKVQNELVNSYYLYHYLRGQYLTLRKISSGDGTRGGLNQNMIRNFEIPLPPINIQEKIVEILDKFTSLEVELGKQLDAEQEARRQQYEYYREKLLTFKRKTV